MAAEQHDAHSPRTRQSAESAEPVSVDTGATDADVRPMRKFFACDECKRRKIRCSGGERCGNCDRDAKACRYSSPSQRVVALQRRLQASEEVRRRMEQAWAVYLPGVNLGEALRALPGRVGAQGHTEHGHGNIHGSGHDHDHDRQSTTTATTTVVGSADSASDSALPAEHVDADDLDFDESEDPERAIDGMAFLTAGPHKSGYTGPQSGIAALKFMQSLPPYLPVTFLPETSDTTPPSTTSVDDSVPAASLTSLAMRARHIDDYFALYHPAYPLLHEGTFRARVAGALAKPRDGSWPLLYHTVLAIGAFVSARGDGAGSGDDLSADLSFFREARRHLSMAVLEKGSLGYVQALTLLANYLQKRNKPNTGFILIGTAFSMAVAIGLHREFGMSGRPGWLGPASGSGSVPSTSPFTMELRRRTWWTLFVFLSGAQLALGRPAVSPSELEVSVRLPANLDDAELAVDMDALPVQDPGRPTVASCLIEQVRLARIANAAQAELAAHQRPHAATVARLEERIRQWRGRCPAFFDDDKDMDVGAELEYPKRVLVWRSLNLRIVLNRPFLFEVIAAGAQLPLADENPVRACLAAADECAASICAFLRARRAVHRGFAWYTTAWLMTASFVQATCLVYMPGHALAAGWRASLQEAAASLCVLGASVEMALRARAIIQNVLRQADVSMCTGVDTMAESTAESREETDVTALGGVDGIHFDSGFQGSNSGFNGFQGGFSGFQGGYQGGFQDSFQWLGETQDDQNAPGGFVSGNGFDLL